MRINGFPWSPVLAGFGAGVAGFALAALATGVIHLGSVATCRGLAVQESTAERSSLAAHSQTGSSPCPCCCEGHRTITTDNLEDSPTQLSAIGRTSALAVSGCEDDFAGASVQLTATSDVAPTTGELLRTGTEPVLDSIVTPTRFLSSAGVEGLTAPPTLSSSNSALADRGGWTGNTNALVSAGNFGSGGLSGAPGLAATGSTGAARPLAILPESSSLPTTNPFASGETGLELSRLAALLVASNHDLLGVASPVSAAVADPTSRLISSLVPTAILTGVEPGYEALSSLDPAQAAAAVSTNVARVSSNPAGSTAVPEPASIVLTLLGISLASGTLWRRCRPARI